MITSGYQKPDFRRFGLNLSKLYYKIRIEIADDPYIPSQMAGEVAHLPLRLLKENGENYRNILSVLRKQGQEKTIIEKATPCKRESVYMV